MSLWIVVLTVVAVAVGLYVGVAIAIAMDTVRSPWTAFTVNTAWPWRWVTRLVLWLRGDG